MPPKRSDDAVAVCDEFLAIVSHDLRNILSSIVLSARTIEESAEGEHREQVIKSAQRIRRGGPRMSRLVGDLLDVASIEAGALAVAASCKDTGGASGSTADPAPAANFASRSRIQRRPPRRPQHRATRCPRPPPETRMNAPIGTNCPQLSAHPFRGDLCGQHSAPWHVSCEEPSHANHSPTALSLRCPARAR
jgi:hypothetical protein